MTNIKSDIIFVAVITFFACAFMVIFGYWELCDYRAWISGDMCECRGEGGFFYEELFTKAGASAILGILFIIGRAVIGNQRNISYKLYKGVCVILLAAVLLLV